MLFQKKKLGCFAKLLQIWSWSHISIRQPSVRIPMDLDLYLSIDCRSNCAWSWHETPKNMQFYRNELNLLEHDTMIREPYSLLIKFEHPDVKYMYVGWIVKSRLILFF